MKLTLRVDFEADTPEHLLAGVRELLGVIEAMDFEVHASDDAWFVLSPLQGCRGVSGSYNLAGDNR